MTVLFKVLLSVFEARRKDKRVFVFFFYHAPISQSQEIHGLVKNDHSVLVDILLCHVINPVTEE